VASQRMSKGWKMPSNFCMKSQSMSALVFGLVTASSTTTQLGASITVLVERYISEKLEIFWRWKKWSKKRLNVVSRLCFLLSASFHSEAQLTVVTLRYADLVNCVASLIVGG
jgi:hypothetical protein